MSNKAKITVVGSGYVGMSLSVLLAQHNDVQVLDIDLKKVDKINKKQSTVIDKDIDFFLSNKVLFLSATSEKKAAYKNANFVIVATPTNYDSSKNFFDTTSVEDVIKDVINFNDDALIIIKSTIPVGFTKFLQEKFKTQRIIFSQNF